ncbi:tetratricopeptide repeat-containing sensor histidine kinase [Winogradskyella haliclonae]|uniref:histidine kinase n=1 Tax=Winogradskyella haliclonae TaxID=2048558 RepID=A0ABQ2BWD9_9FLAO|nr:ATP-binding protein [Winogradskyella haliclonae]GGI56730.1 hypothetical protein GCM10011444_10390 [Winogradskyella haliclonae]
MSAKFLLPLSFLVCFFFSGFSQHKPCKKKEFIESLCNSDKLHKAHLLLSNNSLEESYELIENLKLGSEAKLDKDFEALILFLEGELHRRNNSFKKSVETYELSLSKNTTNNDLAFYAYIALGDIYISGIRDFDKVIPYYKKAELLLDKESCPEKQTLLYNALGNINLLSKNYDEAEKYYIKGLELYLNNNKTTQAAINYSNLGNLYFEQYKDAKAEEYFLKAINTFQKKDSTNINVRQQINYNLFAVNEAKGDYKTAIKYLETSNTLKDSIWNRDKVWEIADLGKKLAVEKKNQELQVLEAENKLKSAQRNGILVSALVLLALLGVSIYYYKEKVKTNKIITSQNETLDTLNATKDKLFSIVSHDLRSSVNTLKSSNRALVSNLETKNIEKLDQLLNTNSSIVNGAYNLLDNLLNWAMLQTKQTYFNIEEHRIYMLVEHVVFNYQGLFAEKEIKFENNVSKKDKILADQESLKIIIRNLIDNAIKFTETNDAISVYSKVEDENYIQLIIEDSGLGMSDTTRLELLKETSLLSKKENEQIIGTGLGIQLCKSMIKKNNGKFSIESQLGKGTKMIVSLPKVGENG